MVRGAGRGRVGGVGATGWWPRWAWARRRWLVGGVGLVLCLVGVLVAVLWPSPRGVYDPPARARAYIAFSACLVTGPDGLADASARAVWSGMQAASSVTRAKVTYLSAVGAPESVGSVTPFVNSLVAQHCGLVLAVGDVEVQAVQSVAASNAGTDFVLVGGGSGAGNVAVIAAVDGSSVSARVASVVEAAVGGRFHGGVVS